MNPLMVFFFLSMMIEDYIFRDGMIIKYSFYCVIIYWIYHLFNKSTSVHSASRKLLLASYSQSYDPTIYSKLNLELKNAKLFIADLETKIGKRVSITLFFAKCMAEVLNKYPECNQTLKFGSLHNRGSVDISVLVDVGGKDLANVCLRDIPNKTFNQLLDELTPQAKSLKEGKDEKFKRETDQFKFLPSFLIALLIEIGGYIANLGITFKPMGIEANKFGSCIISSLGGFKLSNAYAPLCPFTYTSMLFSICSSKIKKLLNKDGTITEKEILPVNIALDHRFLDGALGAKMIKYLKKLFENPSEITII